MALPTIANVYRCTLNWTGTGPATPRNVFHVLNTGNVADVGDALDFAVGELADPSHLYWPTTALITAPTVDILPLDGGSATTTHTLSTPLEGAAGGQVVYQCAGVVTLQTAVGGPRGRGRQYCGPIGEDANVNGFLPSDGKGVMVTAWAAWRDALIEATSPLVVASYVHAQAVSVSSIRVNDYIGTQRRRARGLQAA